MHMHLVFETNEESWRPRIFVCFMQIATENDVTSFIYLTLSPPLKEHEDEVKLTAAQPLLILREAQGDPLSHQSGVQALVPINLTLWPWAEHYPITIM